MFDEPQLRFPSPLLALVTGEPATGKSTVAIALGQQFRLPVIQRDALKESLFDSLGWDDAERSRALGRASFALLFLLMDTLMQAQQTLIVESNFATDKGRAKIGGLVATNRYSVLELQFRCDRDVALARFAGRVRSGERHPGHADHERLSEFAARAGEHPEVPVVPGTAFHMLDTSISSAEEVIEEATAVLGRYAVCP